MSVSCTTRSKKADFPMQLSPSRTTVTSRKGSCIFEAPLCRVGTQVSKEGLRVSCARIHVVKPRQVKSRQVLVHGCSSARFRFGRGIRGLCRSLWWTRGLLRCHRPWARVVSIHFSTEHFPTAINVTDEMCDNCMRPTFHTSFSVYLDCFPVRVGPQRGVVWACEIESTMLQHNAIPVCWCASRASTR